MPIDPRCNTPEPIPAPAPLPYVSREALKRVKDPLPPPIACRYCNGQVRLVQNAVIYKGRSYGKWPYVYLCNGCWAYIGLHPDTDIPLGTLANRALRDARNRTKAIFQNYLSDAGMSRTTAYRWLADQMGIEVSSCHFGWFEQSDCDRVRAIVESAAPQTAMARAFAAAR